MNKRLQRVFSPPGGATRPLLMAGLVAADPYLEATLEYMKVLAEQGADLIELIFPFSDPTYHGAVIQRASARAIREEVSWQEIVDLGQRFRETHQTPVFFSTYYNRILARRIDGFVDCLIEAGFDGAMVTDLPFDEGQKLRRALAERGLSLPPAVAPTTTRERFRQIAEGSDSFIIWTGHAGGDPTISPAHFEQCMQEFKAISPRPIVASMKITDAETAWAITRHCDGILVSSALVWLVEGRGAQIGESLGNFVRELRAGIDGQKGAPQPPDDDA